MHQVIEEACGVTWFSREVTWTSTMCINRSHDAPMLALIKSLESHTTIVLEMGLRDAVVRQMSLIACCCPLIQPLFSIYIFT